MRSAKEIYKKYFVDNKLERKELFEALVEKYPIENTLYPGSFTHVTASFFMANVCYVDTDKQAKRFFADKETVKQLIDTNKTYPQDSSFTFLGEDYTEPLDLKTESFDFLISQFSGIISRYCKNYLKIGGLLLTNNSHADAGVAYLDDDYELVAVCNESGGQTRITDEDLKSYFIPKGSVKPTIESLMNAGKGIRYTKIADNYIFKRIK